MKPQIDADERRFVTLSHRKGREERKAQPQKSLNSEEITRPGTRMARITRIRTDTIAPILYELKRTQVIQGSEVSSR